MSDNTEDKSWSTWNLWGKHAVLAVVTIGSTLFGLKAFVEHTNAKIAENNGENLKKKPALDKKIADPFNVAKDSTQQDTAKAVKTAAPALKAKAPGR